MSGFRAFLINVSLGNDKGKVFAIKGRVFGRCSLSLPWNFLLFLIRSSALCFVKCLSTTYARKGRFIHRLVRTSGEKCRFPHSVIFRICCPSRVTHFGGVSFVLFKGFVSRRQAFRFQLLTSTICHRGCVPILIVPRERTYIRFRGNKVMISYSNRHAK